MSYIDGYFDRGADIIRVVERQNGERVFKEYPIKYTFYYEDPRGKYKSTTGKTLNRVISKTTKDFHKELAINRNKQLFESDINPIFQCLSENYLNADSPDLKIAFFDIEADFDPEKGFSTPSDPFMPITAISVALQWMDSLVTFAVPPKTMSIQEAKEITKGIDNLYLYKDEGEMLKAFLDIIQDADVLSGWNSEGYDIPYVINRIQKVLSKDDTRKLCLWKQLPKKRVFERFGREQETYDLVGRVHLDSLELYRKYTYEERHSYRLDAIGEHELGEKKTVYEGSLDQLYNQDFRTFIEYNRQDTRLIDQLDRKLRFISLTNELAHANTVLLQTTLGAVAVTEQAIINEAHRREFVVPDRPKASERDQAAGAFVATPKKGFHEWVGSMDLNSLYPSVIRAMNMGPETIIGQCRLEKTYNMVREKMGNKSSFAEAWEGIFCTLEFDLVRDRDIAEKITVDWENGETDQYTGAEIYDLIHNQGNPWGISANGTIFRHDIKGIIPNLLERWYAERKVMQKSLQEAIDANDKDKIEFWDKRQLVKKINLNSLYGAILNPGSRFFDLRMGQSVTLTGRSIAKHMSAQVNKVLTGTYDHVGSTIIYGDTDSVYYSAIPALKDEIANGNVEWDKEKAIKLYDAIGEEVNSSFPQFMNNTFGITIESGEIIAAAREIVASRGLFIKKKRYGILVYDQEGNRKDTDGKPGKLKAMGLDLKRRATREFMQR